MKHQEFLSSFKFAISPYTRVTTRLEDITPFRILGKEWIVFLDIHALRIITVVVHELYFTR